jgi:hypothetical protein
MTSFLDKMNLKPHERRMVVIVSLVVFVVLNLWLVWPNFGQLGRVQAEMEKTRRQLRQFKLEIDKQSLYQRQLRELQGQGQFIATEEQALRLAQEVNNQAALTGVNIVSSTPGTRSGSKTNAFFDEQTLRISFNSEEQPLVEFIYNLAARESLTRVRSMTLGPDPKRERLQGNIDLVKSFQRKPVSRSSAPAAVPAAKPASSAAAQSPATAAPATQPPASGATQAMAKVTPPGSPKAGGTNTSAAAVTTTNTSLFKKWFGWLF